MMNTALLLSYFGEVSFQQSVGMFRDQVLQESQFMSFLMIQYLCKRVFEVVIWRTTTQIAKNLLCIPNCATISSRMSKSIVQPCISAEKSANGSRLTGQVILPWFVVAPDAGEILKAYVFVSVMIYSQYACVEAFLNMKQKS